MIWRVVSILLVYALFGIVFAAWAVGNDKVPKDFKNEPYLWLFLNIPFWPVIGLGYLIGELFVKLVDVFQRPEKEQNGDFGDLIERQAAIDALICKGQASRRYRLSEKWELNLDEIKEAIGSVPPVQIK